MSAWRAMPILDEARVSLLESAGGPAFFVELVDALLGDARRYVDALERASTRDELRRAAHALKGSMANFGAARLGALAADLESGDGAPEERLEAHAELARLAQALEARVGRGSPPTQRSA